MSGHMYPTEESKRDKPDYADTGFIAQFNALPMPAPGTVRLFDRQDFYSVHGEDAVFVADSVFKTQSVLKHLGREKSLASCTLTVPTAKSFLREALTAKQLRVEIWSQHDANGRKTGSWTISKRASPGNLQEVEDLLFLSADVVTSPIVLALCVKPQDGVTMVGVAFADATNRQVGVSEYVENDLFSNTESLLIQLAVKECLLPSDENRKDYDLAKLRAVVERCGCVISEVKKSTFSANNAEQDLRRLLKTNDAVLTQLELKLAMASASALLAYLNLLADEANFGTFLIRTHDLSNYLRLDNAALRALSLYPDHTSGVNSGQKNTTVFGLLNRCKTAQGVRMLSQWLMQPLVHVHAIENRQTLLEIYLEDVESRQMLQETFLKFMPDLLRISKRFQRGASTLEDVVRCYQAVERIPLLIQTLADTPVIDESKKTLLHSTFVAPLEELNEHLFKLVEMVEMTIDLDELAHHNYVIKPDFDEGLGVIKAKLTQVRDKLDEQHVQAGRDLRLDTDKKLHLENHSSYGYCFRVTRTDAGVLKNRKTYLDLGTVKGGVYFTTDAMRELNDEFRTLSESYARTQSRLVKDVIDIASSYAPPLEQLNTILAHLDVVLSLAHVSNNAPIPYTKPRIGERGTPLILQDSRHPCLEVQEGIHFIPNDVRIVPDECEFLLVTGPNMGGKSTYMRQIGIITLMAQIGCFIPAAEGAQVPICDCILARVGAGDSQVKGVSTFMAEMLETATILKTASKDSLVLIDELGRGTSTYDGFGLAWAISEWIVTKLHSKCVFATHFHEMTALASQQQGVQNLHVVAHVAPRGESSRYDKDITLLYKVEPGTSDQSYGIQIAELADFPESVIKLAKRKAEELEGDAEGPGALDAPEKDTEQGIALLDEFLRAWVERVEAVDSVKRQRTHQVQLEALQACMRDFGERIEENHF
ncbi:MSH2 protein [Malassezia vespertilionis]|uniref:MSH2 protein n=1 Tax=Malassezia vespertilionis TaxID=2020962 RepID=UPI0024B27BE1|nr:MSH2 protein [Malassezia vespertilionis]WFD08172.1 MSH2 protein [Malassezia vespertilionis]